MASIDDERYDASEDIRSCNCERKSTDQDIGGCFIHEDGGEPVLNLSWRAHSESSLRCLHEMFLTGNLCDVEIRAGEHRISCHRVVLASCSLYFNAMFTSQMQESQSPVVVLKDLGSESVRALILFAYTGLIQVTRGNVEELMTVASFLQVQPVVEGCGGFLRSMLDVSNCAMFIALADISCCRALRVAAERYFLSNFEAVAKTEEFLKLPLPILCRMLSSDLLVACREENVYEAILHWCQYADHDGPLTAGPAYNDVAGRRGDDSPAFTSAQSSSGSDLLVLDTTSRRGDSSPCKSSSSSSSKRCDKLPTLLSALRWPLLAPSFLMDVIQSEPLISRSVECREMLAVAKDYHLMSVIGEPSDEPLEPKQPGMNTRLRACYVSSLYVAGGRGGDRKASSLLPWRYVERYDYRADSWVSVCSMHKSRRHVALCTAGPGLLYAVGGHDGTDHLSSVEVYDPKSDRWSELQPMNTARRGHALVSAGPNGPLYAVGGINRVGSLDVVERYDISQNTWLTVSPMAHSRGGCGAVILGGCLYVAGGNSATESSTHSVEGYDLLTDSWRERTPMIDSRAGFGMVIIEGKIIVAGGFDDEVPLRTAEVYHPLSDTWSSLAPMNVARGGVSISAVSGFVFAVGGHDGNCYLKTVEALGHLPEQDVDAAAGKDDKDGGDVMVSEAELGVDIMADVTSLGSANAGGGDDDTHGCRNRHRLQQRSILACKWRSVKSMKYQRAGPGVASVAHETAYPRHLFRKR